MRQQSKMTACNFRRRAAHSDHASACDDYRDRDVCVPHAVRTSRLLQLTRLSFACGVLAVGACGDDGGHLDDDATTSTSSGTTHATDSTVTGPETGIGTTSDPGTTDESDGAGTTGNAGTTDDTGTGTIDDTGTTGDETEPAVPMNCTEITLGTQLMSPQAYWYTATIEPRLGDPDISDAMHIIFLGFGTVFDLASEENQSWHNCPVCLELHEDGGAKHYFQSQGTVTLSPSSALPGMFTATLTGVRLIQISLNKTQWPYVAVPVEGGGCIDIADVTLDYDAGGP